MAKTNDDVPVVEFEDDDEERGDDPLEVIEGDPNEKPPAPTGKTYDELVAEIQTERARADTLAARVDPVAAMQATLREAIESRQPTSVPAQVPGESEEDFTKRMKESFFEDPVSHLDKWSQRKLAPVVNQLASMTQATLRAQAMMDPEIGGTYKEYAPEVDKIVAARPDRFTNPDVYREAVALVGGRHITEIVAKAVAKAQVIVAPAPTPTPVFSERGGRPAGTARQQVKLTREEIAYAAANGMTPQDYWRTKNSKW